MMPLYRRVQVCPLARKVVAALVSPVHLGTAIGIMAMLAACGGEAPSAPEQAPRPVRVHWAAPAEISLQRRFVGRVAEANLVDVGFEIEGTLLSLPLKEGSAVTKDTLLAQLDPQNTELVLARAKAEHDGAQKALDRLETLLAQGMASQAQYDEVYTRAEISRVEVGAALKRLRDTSLRAPFDGQIVKHYVEPHTPIKSLQPVLQLRPTNAIELEIDIPERYVARWDMTAPPGAWAIFDHEPGVRRALHWREYAAKAHPQTQTVAMTLVLTDLPESTLLPGMTATVLLEDKSKEDPQALAIPIEALQADAQGEPFVWVVKGQPAHVQRRVVDVAAAEAGWVNVVSGLAVGEQVVSAGGAWLYEGMPVRLLAED